MFSDEAKVESYKRFDLPNGGYLIAQITSMKNEGLSSVQDASFTAVPKVRNQKKAQMIMKENKTIKSLSDLASKNNTEIKKALALNQKHLDLLLDHLCFETLPESLLNKAPIVGPEQWAYANKKVKE